MTLASEIALDEVELAGTCRRYSVKALSVFGCSRRALRSELQETVLAEAKTIYAA